MKEHPNDYVTKQRCVTVAKLINLLSGTRQIVRSLAPYSLPPHVAAYIDLVSGVSDFPPIRKCSGS